MQLHGCLDRDEGMVGQIVQRPDKLIGAFLAEAGLDLRLCPHAPQGIPIQPGDESRTSAGAHGRSVTKCSPEGEPKDPCVCWS